MSENHAYPSKLTTKSQVGVPAAVRERLGLRPGGRAIWVLREREAVLMSPEHFAEATAGLLGGVYGRTAREVQRYLEREREDWK